MTEGTSQGLFVVVAIVIFGIFVGLSYTIFGDEMSSALGNLFTDATEQSSEYLNGEDGVGLIVDGVKYKNYSEYYNTFTPNDESDFEFDESTGMITKYIGKERDVVIPNKIKGITVKKIASSGAEGNGEEYGAFYNKGLDSVILPDTLEELTSGNYGAFENNDLSAIIIPDSVKLIGDYTFYDNAIQIVTLSDSLKSIGKGAFNGNNLEVVTIPNSVTTIGSDAFANNKIVDVTLPDSIVNLGNSVFNNNKIKEVTIPNSVTTIDDYAFSNNNLVDVSIPNSVTTLGKSAFANNLLESVNISESITSIKESTFSNNKLTEITIPSSVTEINSRAFKDNNIKNIDYTLNGVTSISNGAFENNPLNDTVTHPIHFLFDESQGMITRYIGNERDVVIPNKIKGITVKKIASSGAEGNGEEYGAFYNKGLDSVILPDTLEELTGGTYGAFEKNNLTEIIIPDSVKSIGKYAFYDNVITEVELGKETSVTSNSFDSNVTITRRDR